MIAKITKRSSFQRLINYANRKDDARLIYYKDVRADSNKTIAMSMQGQTDDKIGRAIKNPVYHVSLNFAQQDAEKITDDFMVKIAQEYLQRMGMINTQYIICRHTDKQHPHLHLIINRVNNDGQVISDQNDRLRSIRICRELTLKYGLYMPRGKQKVKKERLRGSDRIKYNMYSAIKEALEECEDWRTFQNRLTQKGIGMRFRANQDGRIVGVVFTQDGHVFSGSRLDKSLSFPHIDAQLSESSHLALSDYHVPPHKLRDAISNNMRQINNNVMRDGNSECITTSDEIGPKEMTTSSEFMPRSGGASYAAANASAALLISADVIIDLVFPPIAQTTNVGGPSQNASSETEDEKKNNKRKTYKRRR